MGKRKRRSLLLIGLGVALLLAPACTAFISDGDGTSRQEPKFPPGPADGASADGGQAGDGATVLPGIDAGVKPQLDANFIEDGAIKPFSPVCLASDPLEVEGNNLREQANPMTGIVCGRLADAADVDFFSFNATTGDPVRIGFHSDGNAELNYEGAGASATHGAPSPPRYRAHTVAVTGPGLLVIRISGAKQGYRLVVAQ